MLAGLGGTLALPRAGWAAPDFPAFLAQLQARARAAGIPAFCRAGHHASLVPNQDVLKLDHHQPEFTLTWAQYSSHVLSQTRIATGQQKYQSTQNLFAAITSRYGVSTDVMLGIWGLETNFGANQGDFNVIDALTTLAWDRQSRYFGSEVIKAMQIVAAATRRSPICSAPMPGRWASRNSCPAPTSPPPVSFSGNGAPDIWNSDARCPGLDGQLPGQGGLAGGSAVLRAGAGARQHQRRA